MEPKFYSPIQRFLDQTWLVNQVVYLDLWSAVHFSSGLVLGLIILKYVNKINRAWLAFLIISAYEVLELGLNNILFIPETPLDTAWDLIIGMAGFTLAYLIIKQKNSKLKQTKDLNH